MFNELTAPGRGAYIVTVGTPLLPNTITFSSASNGTLIVTVPNAANRSTTISMTIQVIAGSYTVPFDLGPSSTVTTWTPSDADTPLIAIVNR